jgi:hypothetical protein
MNSIKDFQKKPSGAVVNTNAKDYMRARNRNYIRRVQQEMFGTTSEEGVISKVVKRQHHNYKIICDLKNDINDMKNDIDDIKDMLNQLLGEK